MTRIHLSLNTLSQGSSSQNFWLRLISKIPEVSKSSNRTYANQTIWMYNPLRRLLDFPRDLKYALGSSHDLRLDSHPQQLSGTPERQRICHLLSDDSSDPVLWRGRDCHIDPTQSISRLTRDARQGTLNGLVTRESGRRPGV